MSSQPLYQIYNKILLPSVIRNKEIQMALKSIYLAQSASCVYLQNYGNTLAI